MQSFLSLTHYLLSGAPSGDAHWQVAGGGLQLHVLGAPAATAVAAGHPACAVVLAVPAAACQSEFLSMLRGSAMLATVSICC